ncbi:MAG: DUF4238 domain-containing protein [Comamonadaceae bacterium]|nr:MAG: DUF4238 domain-containing protein [Comamonadaceae bacterium]
MGATRRPRSPRPDRLMPGQKQHHTVPRSYLAGFAQGGTLSCVDVRTERQFGISTRDATTARYFYAIPEADEPNAFEDALAVVDGTYPKLRTEIEKGVWPLPSSERDELANFIAVQVTRGRDHRHQLGEQLMRELRDMATGEPEEFAALLALPGAPSAEVVHADQLPPLFVQQAHLLQMILAGLSVPDMLKARRWDLYVFDKPALITSDAPVAPVPDAALGGDAPLGLENALAIQFPLTRSIGLRMRRVDAEVDATDGHADRQLPGSELIGRAFNIHTVFHSHQQLYHHPEDRDLVPEDYQNLARMGGRTRL